MQLFGALATELINICLICGQDTIMDCIMNFIALGVISEIDDYYAASLKFCPIKKQLEEPLYFKEREEKLTFKERNKTGRFLRLHYRLYRILNVAFYFYFAPFLAVIFTYLIGGTVSD